MTNVFRQILPSQVELDEVDPRQVEWDEHRLFDRERAFIRHAVASRRQEFLAGRTMARSAMARLGLPPAEIAPGPDRSPIWPTGATGSITHTNTWCAAAVARTSDVLAVGIDIENAASIPADVVSVAVSKHEMARLENCALLPRELLPTLVFSAKEAAYKAQYTLTGTFLEFDALDIELDNDGRHWRAVFNPGFRPNSFPNNTIKGLWRKAGDLLATSVVVWR